MKTVIIVADGVTQVAFEPENDAEKAALEPIRKHNGKLSIFSGNVFECRGGYWRVTGYGPTHWTDGFGQSRNDASDSLIFRLDAPVPSGVGGEP